MLSGNGVKTSNNNLFYSAQSIEPGQQLTLPTKCPTTATSFQYLRFIHDSSNNNVFHSLQSIEPGQQFTWDHSNLEVNKPKNRYANVIAYDHSRVILTTIDGIPGSDYINANYCDGYRKQNAYIATQGPLPETISDFWRTVWEQRTSTIVMMTKLEERNRVSEQTNLEGDKYLIGGAF